MLRLQTLRLLVILFIILLMSCRTDFTSVMNSWALFAIYLDVERNLLPQDAH